MRKLALLSTLIFAASTSFASAPPVLNYQSIRMFQTDSQLKQAVMAGTVVVSLPQNLLLKRATGESAAKKRIEKVIAMRGKDGQIEKELIVRCELKQLTRKSSVIAPHTSGTANPWRVLQIKNHRISTATWVLGRVDANRVELDCVSFERKGELLEEVALTASMVNRALSTVNGSVMTEVQPSDMNSNTYNDVVAPAATFQDVAQ